MTQIEVKTTFKPSKLDLFFLWIFRKVEKLFSNNKYGMVSGWWQTWRMDYWAWNVVLKSFPTKFMWLTSEYYVDFKKQLCPGDVTIETTSIMCINKVKDRRKCIVEMKIKSGDLVCTESKFMFVEVEHNYCRK